jgi:hypothetical protein
VSASETEERSAAFYCVVSGMYFLGAVGMINSLRLTGHSEPIFALDCGLSAAQRELLEPEATVIPAPEGREPFTLKTYAPLRHPAEVMVLIDADMVVTRSLEPLLRTASEGRVVAFENPVDRFVPEWGELLGLGDVRRQPYLCSGLVAMSRSPGEEILRTLDVSQRRVDFDRTYFGGNDREYPLMFADQDVLNAILASRVEPERIVGLDSGLAPMPPFEDLRLLDPEQPRCIRSNGAEPYLVHQSLPWKPWLEPLYDGVYSRLLRRMLVGEDLAIRVPPTQIPLTLRRGIRASAERQRVKIREQLHWRLGGFLSERLGIRLPRRERNG